MRGARTRRRRNPRFAALCLLLIFAAVGAAVWLWAGRGLPGEGVEVPDFQQVENGKVLCNNHPDKSMLYVMQMRETRVRLWIDLYLKEIHILCWKEWQSVDMQ